MKMLPLLLVNLATVGAGIAVYDQVVRPATPTAEHGGSLVGTPTPSTKALEDRLTALENRGPALTGSPRPGLDRAAVLELLRAELAQARPAAAPGQADTVVVPAGLPAGLTLADVPAELADAYDDPNLTHFRTMYEKVQQMERAEREAQREKEQEQRTNLRLDELKLGLTDNQKGEILAASRKLRESRGDLWRQMRTGDMDREGMRAAMEAQRAELVTTIERIVPNTEDAQRVAQIVGGGARQMAFGMDGEGVVIGGGRGGRGGRGGN